MAAGLLRGDGPGDGDARRGAPAGDGGPLPELDNAYGAPGSPADADLADLLKYTAPADLTGYPALTPPRGCDARGAPMGFQLMGPSLSEASLLRAGRAFQIITGFHTLRAPRPS